MPSHYYEIKCWNYDTVIVMWLKYLNDEKKVENEIKSKLCHASHLWQAAKS